MTVVNAAFHVIRSATRHKPEPQSVYLGNGVWGRTWKVEPIVPSPFCSPWRHPIWWWKLRKLRADILLLEDEVDPALSKRMREIEDDAFLNGSGR